MTIPADSTAAAPIHSESGRRWAMLIAAFTLLLTMIPYLAGYAMSHGRQFMWLGYNLDDSCVYLSWMRQAADGSSRALNLFTTYPQHGMAPNLLFWALGQVTRFTALPLLAVYHLSRLAFGFALLLSVWRLICLLIAQERAQRLAYLFVCFSAGLGWLPFWWDNAPPTPVDAWQPEAITFLSLYLSPLFCFSMLLQVGILILLLRGEQTGNIRYAASAGVLGFLLGMTHTYDVITMAAIWFVYLLLVTFSRFSQRGTSQIPFASWLRAGIAGLLTAPSVAYIAYQLQTESVFRARANVPTLTPQIQWILLGYGLTLLLAFFGAYCVTKSTGSQPTPTPYTLHPAPCFLPTWMIVNIAVAYLPTAFQRKMMQGAHFPIAILAGIGAAWLFTRLPKSAQIVRFPLYAGVLTLLLSLTNILFMRRDIANDKENLAQTKLHRTYLQPGEIQALQWIRQNTAPGTAIQPLPWIAFAPHSNPRQIYVVDTALACFTPGLIDRPVYCGHWGETPDFRSPNGGGKLSELTQFGTPKASDEERIALLKKMQVRYLVFSQKNAEDSSAEAAEQTDELLPMFRGKIPLPSYLQLRYSNPEADVYEYIQPK